MKRNYLIIIISFLFILSLSSCKSFVSENDLMEIVESGTCKAPCWQGITPGVTTKDEVDIRVLDLLSTENVNSGKSPTYVNRSDDMDGFWLTFKYEKFGLEISIFGKDNVEEIRFYFMNLNPRLKSVLRIVGDPELIGVCHEILEIRRELVYFENPISTILYTKQLPIKGTTFIVDYFPDTRVEWIEFRENPTYPGYDFIYPWTDFGQSSFNPENDDPDRPCPDYENKGP